MAWYSIKRAGLKMIPFPIILLLFVSLPFCVLSDDTPKSSVLSRTEYELRYVPEGEASYIRSFSINLKTGISFAKEPEDIRNKDVVRNTLEFYQVEGRRTGFAWDHSAGRLYIDMNANGDLTDDPEGVYEGSVNERGRFSPVIFNVMMDGRPCKVYTEFDFYRYGSHGFYNWKILSSWTGDVRIGSRTWRMTVYGDLDGKIHNRSYHDYLTLDSMEKSDAIPTGLPTQYGHIPIGLEILFNDTFLSFDFKVSHEKLNEPVLKVAVSELSRPFSYADIRGEYIRRLVLQGSMPVYHDHPSGRIRVPVGVDDWDAHILLQPPGDISRRAYATLSDVKLDQDEVTALKVGGPLENQIVCDKSSKRLVFSTQIVGIGGEKYNLEPLDYSTPPEIIATHLGKVIMKSRFSYG